MRAALTRRAAAEVVAAARWITRDSPSAAVRFRDAIREAADLIGRHPDIGAVRADLVDAQYRVLTLRRFPYLVIYDWQSRPVLIVGVLHAARDLPAALRSP